MRDRANSYLDPVPFSAEIGRSKNTNPQINEMEN